MTVVVAGATGDLGGRVVEALAGRGGDVRALVRTRSPSPARERLAALGAGVAEADLLDVDATAAVLADASCVVCALSGLRDVILDRQSVLLDGAVRAGVPRFISSDFCADYTRLVPGGNRNFDLRREFAGRADRAPIAVTSIFNGAFMDMLGHEMPTIQPRLRAVLHWGDRDQPLDFTTRADTAAFTAAAATDDATPRVLRVAGDSVSARDMAQVLTAAGATRYRTLWMGPPGVLRAAVPLVRLLARNTPDPVFPVWQGMQYTHDMSTGAAQLLSLDNDRYPELHWTSLAERFAGGRLPGG